MRIVTIAAVVCGVILGVLPAHSQIFQHRIIIDNQSFRARDICGIGPASEDCASTRQHLTLTQNNLNLEDGPTGPTYLNVLGLVTKRNDRTGVADSLRFCGAEDTTEVNPFNDQDIGVGNVGKFSIVKKVVGKPFANLGANLKALLQTVNIPDLVSDRIVADAKLEYANALTKSYTVSGEWYRVYLKQATLNSIRVPATMNAAAKTCGDFLRNNPRNLVTSIVVIKLNTGTSVKDEVQKIVSGIQAKIRTADPSVDIATIGAGVNDLVTKTVTAERPIGSSVINWDYINYP